MESESATSSGDDWELQVAARQAETAEQEEDIKSASEGEPDKAGHKCVHCSNRKVKNCSNLACKRCCVRIGGKCAIHNKSTETKTKVESGVTTTSEPSAIGARKLRKPVLKNEFKESSVMYYDETVTLFCVRDFFHAKKLSQPLLNDQTRSLRVNGVGTLGATIKQADMKLLPGNIDLKAQVLDTLGREVKRRRLIGQ